MRNQVIVALGLFFVLINGCMGSDEQTPFGTTQPEETWGTGSTSASSMSASTSGQGGTGGTAGGGGMGGTGGDLNDAGMPDAPAKDCVASSECSGKTNECQMPKCIDWKCAQYFMPKGTPLSEQVSGDCLQAQCDGNGFGEIVWYADDPKSDANECTLDYCDYDKMTTVTMPLVQGMLCTTSNGKQGICNGYGKCAECIFGVQGCPDGKTCVNQKCI